MTGTASITRRLILAVSLAAAVTGAVAADRLADPKIGAPAPAFSLTDMDGKNRSLAEFKGKYVVLEWINHGCPFIRKHYDSGNMQGLQKETAAKGVAWLSICSSAPGREGSMTPGEWKKTTAEQGAAPTAVLLDPDGGVGRLYGAKTTPHMFIVDPAGVLIYKGAIDDKPTTDVEDVKGATNYVRQALAEAMAGKPVSAPETRAYGCSVKYK
jgi:peroxiredoxin